MEVHAARSRHDAYLEQSKKLNHSAELTGADARMVSPASVPVLPSFPPKREIIIAALAFGAALGFLIVFLLDAIEGGFRSEEELERKLGLPCFTLVPTIRLGLGLSVDTYIVRNPFSEFSENFRVLKAALFRKSVQTRPRTIVFTSSRPDEGKTFNALAFGQLLANSSMRVLLVDADLRVRRLSTQMGFGDVQAGLAELVVGNASVAEVIQTTKQKVDILPAKEGSAALGDIFEDDRFASVMTKLASSYEVIVIDAPPVLVLSDAASIAQHADLTLMCVEYARTPVRDVQSSVRQLSDAQVRLAGFILSRAPKFANPRRDPRYLRYYKQA
jgi:Mrp family chromosome partitioning ATPase